MKTLYSIKEFDNSKGSNKLPLECEKCGEVFYAPKSNIKYEQNANRGRLKFCSTKCCSISQNKAKIFTIECKCGKKFHISTTENNFKKGKYKKCCSSECSHNRKLSEETKRKTSESIKNYYKSVGRSLDNFVCQYCKEKFKAKKRTQKFCSKSCQEMKWKTKLVCKNCNTEFECKDKRKKCCSNKCVKLQLSLYGRKGGLKSAYSQSRRSKNEIAFAELCVDEFKNVLTNSPIFNGWDADVIIEDLKVAILWNGIWHYKKIREKISLKQIQNRDLIKIEEIKNCGYLPYIIKDLGEHSMEKVNLEFNKFLKFVKNNLER